MQISERWKMQMVMEKAKLGEVTKENNFDHLSVGDNIKVYNKKIKSVTFAKFCKSLRKKTNNTKKSTSKRSKCLS